MNTHLSHCHGNYTINDACIPVFIEHAHAPMTKGSEISNCGSFLLQLLHLTWPSHYGGKCGAGVSVKMSRPYKTQTTGKIMTERERRENWWHRDGLMHA